MKHKLTFLLVAVLVALGAVQAQTPIVVVPASSTTVTATAAAPVSETSSLTPAIKLLQEIKATNTETLKKQETLLQQLDELQKTAEQMKAFSKRG
jgi:cell shape-determining protein MreC